MPIIPCRTCGNYVHLTQKQLDADPEAYCSETCETYKPTITDHTAGTLILTLNEYADSVGPHHPLD